MCGTCGICCTLYWTSQAQRAGGCAPQQLVDVTSPSRQERETIGSWHWWPLCELSRRWSAPTAHDTRRRARSMLADARRISWWTSHSRQTTCRAAPHMMAALPQAHTPRMRIGAFNPLESVPGAVRQNKHTAVVLTAGHHLLGRNSKQQRLRGTKLTLALSQQLPYHVRWGLPRARLLVPQLL